MSGIRRCLSALLLAPFLGGALLCAAEFEVLDRFSVDGYAVLRGSADISGGGFTVGGSTLVVKEGNVGIGTTAPVSQLHVHNAGTDASSYARFTNGSTGAGLGNGFLIGVDAANEYRMHGNGNTPLKIFTNNLERFRVDGSGNVSMGTAGSIAGGRIFRVYNGDTGAGSFVQSYIDTDAGYLTQMVGSAANGGVARVYSGATGGLFIYTAGATQLQFGVNSAEAMRISAAGNVGIGTIAPGLRADITGSFGWPAASGAAQTGILRLGQAAGNGKLDFGFGDDGSNPGGWLQVTNSADLSQKYNLLLNPNGGNVGIGTAAPGAILQVSAGSGSFASTNFGNGIFVRDNNTAGAAPNIRVQGQRSDGAGQLGFAGGLALERYRTDAGQGANVSLGFIAFGGNHTNGTEANIRYAASIQGVSESAFTSVSAMSTGLAFFTGSAGTNLAEGAGIGTERVRITSDGNVGIGTTAPAAKLEVAGQIKITGGSPGAGKILVSDANGLASWVQFFYSLLRTLTYTGGDQNFVVPAGVTSIKVEVLGASGAGGTPGGWSYGAAGGGGGYASAIIPVTPGETLKVVVGQGGGVNSAAGYYYGGGASATSTGSDNRYGSGGGGMSAIFRGASPLVIAGGGGGGGSSRAGTGNYGGAGGGGGLPGEAGQSPYDGKTGYAGGGGTLTAGGTATGGQSGTQYQGGHAGTNGYGGGGGGGYWGGAGGGYSESNTMAGGGGGSGYYSPSVTGGVSAGAGPAGGGPSTAGTNGTVKINYY